ncbi:glycosyltransferase [Fodinisporobacter ferrooxydans]|uniref:Glycosyltransferase n=1 Tax=Fodinisporobacter ferrooxydans TaxID=2901836 RepID=A0ABY4CMJ1_9BACL|nr:glycosyltransferase [Alicyclobacillaceae bacterium MYW30-H2]
MTIHSSHNDEIQDEIQMVFETFQRKNYSHAEQMAIDFLKKFPFHEQMLKLLGDILLVQGLGQMAKQVYERAYLFHPQATWFQSVQSTLQKSPAGENKVNVENLLAIKSTTTVAAAILTKNEERCIKRCIESLLDAVDEIILIDTGSSDRTVEFARNFAKVKILSFKWCEDFSAARNFGLKQIESNWILWVDADEYLHPEDVELVRESAALLETYEPTPLLHPVIWNVMEQSISVSYSVPRMFPIRGNLRFHGRIHEQIGPSDGNRYTNLRTHDFFVRFRLVHDGYDPKQVNLQEKLERNIRLLSMMTQEEPDDPTWWLYLGREVLATKQMEKGISYLLKAEEKGKITRGFGALLEIQRLLVQAYMILEDYSSIENTCNRMLQTDPDFPDTYYYLASMQIEKAKLLYQIAEENVLKAKETFHNYLGLVTATQEIADWKADLLLANIFTKTGRLYNAKKLYQDVATKSPVYKTAIEGQIEAIHQEAQRIVKES